MEITKVSYRKTKSVGYNEAECIEATAIVDSGTTAEETLSQLQHWVSEKLQIHEDVSQLNYRKNDLQSEIHRIEERIKYAQSKWKRVKDFLDKLGIDSVDDIPF